MTTMRPRRLPRAEAQSALGCADVRDDNGVEDEHGAASLGRPPPDPAESGRGGWRSAASGTAADDGARGSGGVRRGGEFRTATVGEEEPAPDPDRDREETRERVERGGKEWGTGLGFRCPQGLVGEVGVGRSNQADWMASWLRPSARGGGGFPFLFFYLQSYTAFLLFILLVLICFILVSKIQKWHLK